MVGVEVPYLSTKYSNLLTRTILIGLIVCHQDGIEDWQHVCCRRSLDWRECLIGPHLHEEGGKGGGGNHAPGTCASGLADPKACTIGTDYGCWMISMDLHYVVHRCSERDLTRYN